MHKIKSFLYFLKTIYQQRYVIKKLVARDFQKKYLGSYLGLPWAFLQPAMFVVTMWVVFTIGLRVGYMDGGIPFLPWFMCGIIPWFFISESINTSTSSLLYYSFLIKQMYFRVGVIPLITIITALIIHLFLVVMLMVILFIFGYTPTVYWIQLPYYMLGSMVLLTGIGWLTSSLAVFVRDVEQAMSVFLTIFFWLTPIFWSNSMLTGNNRYIALLNPFFYITNGYRETFITQVWFFEHAKLMIYFWGITGIIFVGGALVFQRLKPHFADVL